MKSFTEFIDRKERQAIKHLKILHKLLESQDFKVSSHLKDEDPYIFVWDNQKDASFAGIRIYHIGDIIAYRIQNEENTHPYGKAYSINVEEMFDDLLYDHKDPEKAGKATIKAVVKEVNRFFKKSAEAEKDLRAGEFDWDRNPQNPMNRIVVKIGGGPDWGNMVYNPK